MHKLYVILILLFIACKSNKNNINVKTTTIRKGDLIISGHILSDSTYDDTITYTSNDGNLVRKETYKNGRQNGLQIEYYTNGHQMSIMSFENGLKNGFSQYYDSIGKLIYSDFYYYNLTVGPIIYYDSSDNPKRYFFSNLQNEDLLDINYKNWKGISSIVNKCINFTTNKIRRGDESKLEVLMYLINPPKFSFEYSVFKKKLVSQDDSFTNVKTISNNFPFKYIELPMLNKDEQYLIGLTVYDSILNKKTIVYKDL